MWKPNRLPCFYHNYAAEKRKAWRLLGAQLSEILAPIDQDPNVEPIGRAA
jgi:hypothetical protein